MKYWTYQEILDFLKTKSPDQLAQTATIWLREQDEHISICGVATTSEECDTLDPGHIVLTIDF